MGWPGRLAVAVLVVVALLAAAVRLTTFHPPAVADVDVTCPREAPRLSAGEELTVMSWNVQFMAGTGYVFFFDVPDGDGPDERPSAADVTATIDQVARVIRAELPDVVLLQEVDDGADRTDGEDQLARLLELVGDAYPCHASAFYWQASFVPHPRILGSVGMKLSTISRVAIDDATRYQLPQMPADPLTRQFELKRAVLETRLPVEDDGTLGEDLVVLNTHLDAFAQGTDTMERQVAQVATLLHDLDDAGEPWVLGGDLNLLPPGGQYDELPPDQQAYYRPDSELAVLTDRFDSVPSVAEATGLDAERWFTHQPNDPAVDGPDRTIDYLFHSSSMTLGEHEVVRGVATEASDHLPVVATYRLP